MNELNGKILKNNPKIDQKVVAAANELQQQLPEFIKPKQGADYNISPALGGSYPSINHFLQKS